MLTIGPQVQGDALIQISFSARSSPDRVVRGEDDVIRGTVDGRKRHLGSAGAGRMTGNAGAGRDGGDEVFRSLATLRNHFVRLDGGDGGEEGEEHGAAEESGTTNDVAVPPVGKAVGQENNTPLRVANGA